MHEKVICVRSRTAVLQDTSKRSVPKLFPLSVELSLLYAVWLVSTTS